MGNMVCGLFHIILFPFWLHILTF
ncbi:hypothetical protein [Plasmodium yoelii yoelii]|uniref:Uncharacterized protein n=1 Tax=Plasmodium yoelii yoelii TaxID=73239 RepID=Q7RSP4_PLAYO|nr:hypothetical protein [Plasmodium yoelii yoelii]